MEPPEYVDGVVLTEHKVGPLAGRGPTLRCCYRALHSIAVVRMDSTS